VGLTTGLTAGLAIGVVTAIIGSCTPFVEWAADHVPEKWTGVFGVCLILIGLTLQSVQYWLALLDVNVRLGLMASRINVHSRGLTLTPASANRVRYARR